AVRMKSAGRSYRKNRLTERRSIHAVAMLKRSSLAMRSDEPHPDVVELVVVAVLDDEQAALARPALDLDLETQHVCQLLLERQRIRGLLAPPAGLADAA